MKHSCDSDAALNVQDYFRAMYMYGVVGLDSEIRQNMMTVLKGEKTAALHRISTLRPKESYGLNTRQTSANGCSEMTFFP